MNTLQNDLNCKHPVQQSDDSLFDLSRRINQYFDGKRTDDEILYRAEISRKQLREVLHHYEEYVRSPCYRTSTRPNFAQLQTFLHPA